MKKGILFILFLFAFLWLNAQDFSTQPATPPRVQPQKQIIAVHRMSDSLTKFYLGFGMGLNNYCGMLGIGADLRVYKRLLVRVGAGIGSWGNKLTVGLRYQRRYTKGWVYGIGYSSCSGLTNFKIQLPTGSNSAPVNKEVTLDLLHASTFNLTTSYNWVFHSHHKFFIEFGYAFALETNPFVVKDGSVLTDVGVATLKLVRPGGLITGVGLMFGL